MPFDLETELADEMDAFSARQHPPSSVDEEPLRAWRPQGAYPSDFDRRRLRQDCGPEWDFCPADER